MSFSVIIPARYASSRLPGKPLRLIAGTTMIEHTYRRAEQSGAKRVVVATDDSRIAEAVEAFGGECCITSGDHLSGTDRIAEAVTQLGFNKDDIVVNLQGDEPLMPPQLLQQVAAGLTMASKAEVATLATLITTANELFDPNVVKVVFNQHGSALYFSRAPIPWDRDAFSVTREELPRGSRYYRHLGIYAYRVGFLQRYRTMESTSLEMAESLEQLRVLWHGGEIQVAVAEQPPGHGVDTEADLVQVSRVLEEEKLAHPG